MDLGGTSPWDSGAWVALPMALHGAGQGECRTAVDNWKWV